MCCPLHLVPAIARFIDGSDAEIFVGGGHPKAVNYQVCYLPPPGATARRFSMGRCGNSWWGGHPKAVNYQGLLSTPPLAVFDGSMLEFLVGGTSKSCKKPGSALYPPTSKSCKLPGSALYPPCATARRFSMGRCWNFCWGGHPKGVNYQGLLSTHPLCATARRLGGHP